jgi:DNA-binding NarL/FixJ family response regulator
MQELQNIKVLCVDDNVDVAELLRIVIDTQPGLECVGVVCQPDEIIAAVAKSAPDVVVLDLSMPGRDTLTLLNDIAGACPKSRVIVYSGYDDAQTRETALEAGAWGLVSKHHDSQRLIEAIRQVSQGELLTS